MAVDRLWPQGFVFALTDVTILDIVPVYHSMDRRSFLERAMVGTLAAFGSTAGTGSATATSGTLEDEEVDRGPRRGTARMIDNHTVEADDEITYLQETNQVQYIAARRAGPTGEYPDGIPLYGRSDWETWAQDRCAQAGAGGAQEHVQDERPEEIVRSLVRVLEGETFGSVVLPVYVNPDGHVLDEPGIDFDELVSITPESVLTTYVLNGHIYTHEVPIYAEFSTIEIRGERDEPITV